MVDSGLLATRATALQTTFTVHNGSIWRMSSYMLVDVPSGNVGAYAGEYALLVRVRSVDAMPDRRTDFTEQMEEHPFYLTARPSGCMNCMRADVYYSTHTPKEQIAQLTTFNFDCITRFRSCRFLAEVLPAAGDWDLYPGPEPGSPPVLEKPHVPRPCPVPMWATARDHEIAVVADVKETGTVQDDWYGPREKDRMHIVSVLKGNSSVRPGSFIDVIPFAESPSVWDYEPSEHMKQGSRYLLFFHDSGDDPPLPSISLDRCGLSEDTPENRRDVEKGMAMNDDLRRPERW